MFKVGDVVTWTHVWRFGGNINMATRTAKIIRVMDQGSYMVKYRGKEYILPESKLRSADAETTELTDMVMGPGN